MTTAVMGAAAWDDLVSTICQEKTRAVARLSRAAGLDAPRVRREQARLAEMIARATPPAECGPQVIAAPARGPMLAFQMRGLVPVGASGWAVGNRGHAGRSLMRKADVFDLMQAQANRKGSAGLLFTHGQVAIARHYRDLVERHDAGGMKCASLEARRDGGGGQGGEFMDAYVHEGDVIRAMQRRIGDGSAMVVRRIRPSERGSRATITDRRLVDMVCLEGRTLSDVLAAHGWKKSGKHIMALQIALRGALDRMQGYMQKGD